MNIVPTTRYFAPCRYAKLDDIDNWLIVDEKTADIRLSKLPDRESKFLVNGTYYTKIICITNGEFQRSFSLSLLATSQVKNRSKCVHVFYCLAEVPSKTATGTIAIQVEDFNDHCPTLTSTTPTMCLEDNFIYVTAIDRDEFPNSSPFEFTVVEGTSWTIEPFNGELVAPVFNNFF